MQRARTLLLDGERQETYVLPCCVFFFPDVCLFITHLGFIQEQRVNNEVVCVEKAQKSFPSRIIPVYTFMDMQTFVDSRFNYYRMLWNSKFNTTRFMTALQLLLLRKYAVQNDRFNNQTTDLIGERSFQGEIPELIIKFI